ncbi:hypothetical protein KSZ_78970 [Dictyobacter formicarum]|uniref:Uncharacterized protein n=1 Tax=Dictyobacter formicarum TaxID=2778368 RepID=A0ABQ3VX70_9CHLR|nr:hypothetical protein KSZ_78970 [Dictyobacter formicarum]
MESQATTGTVHVWPMSRHWTATGEQEVEAAALENAVELAVYQRQKVYARVSRPNIQSEHRQVD